jgi:hypothetical protein
MVDSVCADLAGPHFGGGVMSARTDRIDTAISAASELIGFLQDAGPVNGAQARLIVDAAVRAAVPNVEDWEVKESAARIAAELENEDHSDNV